jgi:pSer/pThr/pTyr-binding forkhead associated (FHA) protein
MPAHRSKSDGYVDRLGDRISAPHGLPEAASPGFQGPPLPPGHSDIHRLPGSPEEDEALDSPPPPTRDTGDAFAEFEDIEGETTRIDDSQLLAEQSTAILEEAPKQPFLAVERGNDKGREFVLQDGENGVGRGIDNDVILADVAVSRRHLIVIRDGATLRLRDLGSGNGTQVNGKRVSNLVLADGDRIELGETVLVVRTPGGLAVPPDDPEGTTDESHVGGSLPPPAPATPTPFAPPPGPGYQPELTPSAHTHLPVARPPKNAVVLSKPVFLGLLAGGAMLLALLGATVAILVLRLGSDDDAPQVTLAAEASPFQRGVRAYGERRWDDAEAAFREALQASGSDPRANEYLQRTQQAREHQGLVEQARAALARGDANAALTQASSVPATSPLSADAQTVRAQAQGRLVSEHVGAARRALDAGDPAEAGRRLALAQNLDPASPAVIELAAAISRASTGAPTTPTAAPPAVAPAAPAAPTTSPTPTTAPTPATAPTTAPAPATAPTPPPSASASPPAERTPRTTSRTPTRTSTAPIAMPDIIAAYLAGRFDQATQLARTSASRSTGRARQDLEQLAGNIERFGRLYTRIQAARFGPAVRADMEQAIALDRRIARASQYRDRLRGPVVDAYMAEAQRQRANPSASCAAVRQALTVDASHAGARQASAQCEVQARALLRDAASAPPDRATSLYRSALLMVPSGSPVAREASDRLEALRRSRPMDEDE